MNEYMKNYTLKNNYYVRCPLCDIETKKCLYKAHEKTKKHKQILLKLKNI